MKPQFSKHIFEIYSNTKFHEIPSRGSGVVLCRRTDRQADMTKLRVAFRNLAKAPENLLIPVGTAQHTDLVRDWATKESWFDSEQVKRFDLLQSIQTCSGAQSISYSGNARSTFPRGLKQLGRESDHAPPSSANFNKACSYTSSSHMPSWGCVLLRTVSICLFLFVCYWRDSPQWARVSSFTRFLDHIQRRITVGMTPLDEWSARRRDLYLTTHNNHYTQTPMLPVRFEPTISAGEWP